MSFAFVAVEGSCVVVVGEVEIAGEVVAAVAAAWLNVVGVVVADSKEVAVAVVVAAAASADAGAVATSGWRRAGLALSLRPNGRRAPSFH